MAWLALWPVSHGAYSPESGAPKAKADLSEQQIDTLSLAVIALL